MPFVDTTDETKLFGYTGAQRSQAAWENWKECWSGAHEYMFKVDDKLDDWSKALNHIDDTAIDAMTKAVGSSQTPIGAPKPGTRPTAKHPAMPRRPRGAKRDVARDIDEAAVVVDEEEGHPYRPPPRLPLPHGLGYGPMGEVTSKGYIMSRYYPTMTPPTSKMRQVIRQNSGEHLWTDPGNHG